MPDRTTPDQPKPTDDSATRRAEEVETHIDEAGRFDTGLEGTAERLAGIPPSRDFTTADTDDVPSDEEPPPAG